VSKGIVTTSHFWQTIITPDALSMDLNTQYDQASLQDFDYVIIGGGTAGLTLAARLTEDPDVAVVVLEAGEKRLDVWPTQGGGDLGPSVTDMFNPGSKNSHPEPHDYIVWGVCEMFFGCWFFLFFLLLLLFSV
jgi:hypothetical protein